MQIQRQVPARQAAAAFAVLHGLQLPHASTLVSGSSVLNVEPGRIARSAHIDGLGRRTSPEAAVSGTAADEADEFRPALDMVHGTPFQRTVWAALQETKPGETVMEVKEAVLRRV